MYGLMRAGICSRHKEQAYHRRLHYCGTCKTMGRLYGQKSRFLLNNDSVFLAELLSALTPGGAPVPEWDRSYQSINCFSLPAGSEEMPLALQVSATATLVMSEFKVADQLDDGANGKWKLAQRVYSQSFCDASQRMKAWRFPVADMWERYQTQRPREQEAQTEAGRHGVIQTIEFVAEPTATVTGWTFQHGAAVVGAAEDTQQTMFALGSAFGSLVYVLDALEDYQADLKKGDFNALQAAFQLPGASTGRGAQTTADPGASTTVHLPDSCRATMEAYLWELAARATSAIESLPLPAGQAALFTARLNTNLARRLAPPDVAPRSSGPLLQRLVQALGQVLRMSRLRPAHATSGGSPPAHLAKMRSRKGGGEVESGVPQSEGPPTRARGGGCGCGGCDGPGCDCCTIACCDGGCECCGDGACAACECCEGCGACGECCGSCGSCVFVS